MDQVRPGDVVRIHYTGRLPDGEVFGTSEGKEPVEFVAGGDGMLAGLSEAVLGMSPGERKSVTLTPEKGFGERDESLVRQVPRGALPPDIEVGDRVRASDAESPFWVRELGEQSALLDGNPPLAGQTLIFEIELVSSRPAA